MLSHSPPKYPCMSRRGYALSAIVQTKLLIVSPRGKKLPHELVTTFSLHIFRDLAYRGNTESLRKIAPATPRTPIAGKPNGVSMSGRDSFSALRIYIAGRIKIHLTELLLAPLDVSTHNKWYRDSMRKSAGRVCKKCSKQSG